MWAVGGLRIAQEGMYYWGHTSLIELIPLDELEGSETQTLVVSSVENSKPGKLPWRCAASKTKEKSGSQHPSSLTWKTAENLSRPKCTPHPSQAD